jgi:hypothetical protein
MEGLMSAPFAYDRKRMTATLENIASDLIKLPGQAGLKPDDRFALTMTMLVRLNAVIIAAQAHNRQAAEELLGLIVEQTTDEMHKAGRLIAGARAIGFGRTIPWDILAVLLKEEDDEEEAR